jgi:class 3 adenylate cyclase
MSVYQQNRNMENNDLTSTSGNLVIPDHTMGYEKEMAILFLDILNFTGLMESQPAQTLIGVLRRLNGSQPDLDYLMAISG